MFRLLFTSAVAIAVLAHAQWGCVACHSHSQLAQGPADYSVAAGHSADEHDGHSHRGHSEPVQPHSKHPCHSDGHCFFVLRLPTGSEPLFGVPVATPLTATVIAAVAVEPPALTSTATTLDMGRMRAALRRAQYQVLLL